MNATTYTLNAAATALATTTAPLATLQAPAKGLGNQWRAAGFKAPNTRAGALAVIAGLAAPFTLEAAVAALQAAKAQGLNLGSGTPRSYCVAFVKNGYFAPATVEAPAVEAPAVEAPAVEAPAPTKRQRPAAKRAAA